jgi:hypothetical protein
LLQLVEIVDSSIWNGLALREPRLPALLLRTQRAGCLDRRASTANYESLIEVLPIAPTAAARTRTRQTYFAAATKDRDCMMRVQQRIPSPSFHSHAHQSITPSQSNIQSHLNGTHSGASRPSYSASTTEHLNGDNMNPYHNPYSLGNGPPQPPYQQHQHQQPQYLPQNQLPPMQGMPSSMRMPPSNGMSSGNSMPPSNSMAPSMSMPPPPVQPPGQGVAGPSNNQHPTLYPAVSTTGLPQPGARALEAQVSVSSPVIDRRGINVGTEILTNSTHANIC